VPAAINQSNCIRWWGTLRRLDDAAFATWLTARVGKFIPVWVPPGDEDAHTSDCVATTAGAPCMVREADLADGDNVFHVGTYAVEMQWLRLVAEAADGARTYQQDKTVHKIDLGSLIRFGYTCTCSAELHETVLEHMFSPTDWLCVCVG
jgi:hypothetical protein